MSFPVRRTARQGDELLDPDFRKTGASGRLWTRVEMVPALVGELSDGAGAIEVTEMAGAVGGPEEVVPDLVELEVAVPRLMPALR